MTRGILGASALGWIITIGLAAPAEAQLFPNAPIKRERTNCIQEAPVFHQYRQMYYGYHPTCWRKFPDGWGCPSPEAPNRAAEYQARPLQKPDATRSPEGGLDLEPPGGPERPGEMEAPQLPSEETDPFKMDTTPGAVTPRGGQRPGAPAGGPTPPVPPANRSPFDLDPRSGSPSAAQPPAGTNPDAALDLLRPLAPQPSASTPPPSSTLPPPNNSTMPRLPDLALGTPINAPMNVSNRVEPGMSPTAYHPVGLPVPPDAPPAGFAATGRGPTDTHDHDHDSTQAPKRKRLLGGLFSRR